MKKNAAKQGATIILSNPTKTFPMNAFSSHQLLPNA